jgi:hypothetical protein
VGTELQQRPQKAQRIFDLALCGGAGLTATAELVRARIQNISPQGHRVFVQVNGTRAPRADPGHTWYRVLDSAIDMARTDGDLFPTAIRSGIPTTPGSVVS